MHKYTDHKYFEQKTGNWNILGFLEDCDAETLGQKIECYIKCLEAIVDNEGGERWKKAKLLLDRYRSKKKPDFHEARRWEQDRKRKVSDRTSFHMNNPTFIGDAQIGNYGPIKLIKNDGSNSRKRCWLNNELTKKKNKLSNEPEKSPIDISESRSDEVRNAGQTSSSKKSDDEIDNFLRGPNERKPNQFVEKLKKSETTDEVHIETIHHDSSDDTTYDPDGEDVGEDVNEEVDEEMSEMSMSEFKKSFLKVRSERRPNQFVEKLKKSENTDEVHIETIHHDSSDDTTYDPDGEDMGEDVNEEVDEEMSKMSMSEFKKSFLEMRNNRKWYLKSGKCVEDELYAFGIKCRFEHLAHSFIIDPDDETYIQYEIFTPEELEEIRNTGAKGLPKMPDDLLKYVGSFRKKTTADLRMVLDTRQDWEGRNFDKTKHFDFDWIKNTVHSLLPEYEFGTLQRKHLELWYNIHVWSLIDKSFSDLEGMDATRGESCSLASSKRKNKRRIIQGIVKTTRKALGRRGDLILRKGSYEYGTSEVGKDYEGENGTKLLKERGLKSPKMLKDMLVDLGNFVKWKPNKLRQLELVSFIHAGLYMILLRMDVPAGYICRISRSDTLQIPADVKCFENVLKCMILAWKAKAIVCKTIDVVEGINDNELDDLQDLQEAGVRKCENLTVVPNCVKTPRKKRTVNKLNT